MSDQEIPNNNNQSTNLSEIEQMDNLSKNRSISDSSDSSADVEEFYDAHEVIVEENKSELPKDETNNSQHINPVISGQMVDSGIASMQSSHIETQSASNDTAQHETKTDDNEKTDSSSPALVIRPLPPPRIKKRKNVLKNTASNELNETGNHSSAESRSVTNSIESTTPGFSIHNQNLASILDDIASIKGDLSITEVDDKRSTYHDDHLPQNRKPLVKQEFIFSNERLQQISRDIITKDNLVPANNDEQPQNAILNQVVVMDINTGEKIPLSKAENILPNCLNPLSLHLMKLTNTEMSDNEMEKETTTSLADSTFKSVTSLISSKIEKKDKSLDKKNKKKLFDSNENDDQFDLNDDDEEYDEYDKNFKDGKIKSQIRHLKRIGSGLIRGVKSVKAPSNKKRSTFHVDLKSCPGEFDIAPQPRYKIKVNHKRGTADFDGLKLIQEINDCKGAIWCMKFSNCSQLLAAAGQDHLLRVYCAQKSWKYFTQLRNKASGQHCSPNSTKERSSNGDSFGRKTQKSSFSRNGSLNTSDSHNNSSSSNSSALAKEYYKDEDNTLSEEGPLLLFTIYRGHTADVLDLAWSKNHFLLSSSMDKTVRLWHITRIECLCTFRHIDFVTTIQFHPRDDRYFLSGSLDGKLRLWNIPDKRVTLWNEVSALPTQRGNGSSNVNDADLVPSPGLITASSFVEDGKFAVIGTYDGRVIFYTTDQLKYFTQIHVNGRNVTSSSQSSSTRRIRTNKVTGIESIDTSSKILVTTNDSRLRLYDLRDLSLTCKYKGCINQCSQIKASFSHDHKYIICGSENNSFYIWRVQDNSTIGQRRDRNKQYECIRLLNIPIAQPAPNVFPSEVASRSESNNTSNTSALDGKQSKDNNTKLENDDTYLRSREGSDLLANTSQPQAYSNAATKIVTSAIFAPVPGLIEEKAPYIIAAADFNGYIRIFSKH